MNSKSNIKLKGSLLIALLFIFIAVGFFKYDYLKAYFKNARDNSYSKGNSVYASGKFVANTSPASMDLIKVGVTDTGYVIIFTGKAILNDTLRKYKTSLIGTYIDYKMIPIRFGNKQTVFRLYAIKPYWKIVEDNSVTFPERIPTNCKLLDNNYYIVGNSPYLK